MLLMNFYEKNAQTIDVRPMEPFYSDATWAKPFQVGQESFNDVLRKY